MRLSPGTLVTSKYDRVTVWSTQYMDDPEHDQHREIVHTLQYPETGIILAVINTYVRDGGTTYEQAYVCVGSSFTGWVGLTGIVRAKKKK